MNVEIVVKEDENFKIVDGEEETPKAVEQPIKVETPQKPQPTLENPKGHSWFDGTSWGTK
jgi:hypothetical protein